MKTLKEIDKQSFTDRFTTDRNCHEFLAELKRTDGYSSKKCGSTTFFKRKQSYSRRSSKCGYDETYNSRNFISST